MRDALDKLPLVKQVLSNGPKVVSKAPCHENVVEGPDVDLNQIPIWTCWPDDAAFTHLGVWWSPKAQIANAKTWVFTVNNKLAKTG